MPTFAAIIQSFDPTVAFDPPPDWLQGRTLYGGLSAALALIAATRVASADLPPLKSAQITFIGPVSEPMNFEPHVLRTGRTATFIAVDGVAGGKVALRAMFVFASPRPSEIAHDFLSPPVVKPAAELTPMDKGTRTPAFMHHFDMRTAGGARLASGAADPRVLAWVRHLDATGVDPAVALLALADALPPAAMTSMKAFAPISSVTWTLSFARPALAGDWYLLRAISQQARDGYSEQTMQAWAEDGALVLSGGQSVAIFV